MLLGKSSYTGKTLLKAHFFPKEGEEKQLKLAPYYPDPGLVDAVNLALLLKRPLLLMGEPGCGKTKLAQAIAFDLYKNETLEDLNKLHQEFYEEKDSRYKTVEEAKRSGKEEAYELFFFEWRIKSTSKAQDGIYSFDALQRLQDTQVHANLANLLSKKEQQALVKEIEQVSSFTPKEKEEWFSNKGYLNKGPLARAFDFSQATRKPAILLIDEIDKAETDFPNDLLLELDEGKYFISETGSFTEIDKSNTPLIIITSNNEKDLPPAFLRRCIFYFIDFPDTQRLESILEAKFKESYVDKKFPAHDFKKLLSQSVKVFEKIRIAQGMGLSQKKISTSELIDWFEVLLQFRDEKLNSGSKKNMTVKQVLEQLVSDSEQLSKDIPFYPVLLKNVEHINAFLDTNPVSRISVS